MKAAPPHIDQEGGGAQRGMHTPTNSPAGTGTTQPIETTQEGPEMSESTTNPLQAAIDAAATVRDKREQYNAAVAARDAAIRAALAAGTGATELVRATGLSRGNIYQIRDKKEN